MMQFEDSTPAARAKNLIQVAADIVSQDQIRQEAPKLIQELFKKQATAGEFYGFFIGLLRSAKSCSQAASVTWLMDEFLPDSIKGKMLERLVMEEIAMASATKQAPLLLAALRRAKRLKSLGRIETGFVPPDPLDSMPGLN